MLFLTHRRSLMGLVCLCSSIVFFDCHQVSATAESEIKRFDVPEGKATKTLKQVARQAEVEFLFSASVVRGVRTHPIQGEFAPFEAFDLMLAGTSLAAFQHEKSGVYTIRKAKIAEDANGDSNTVNTTPMNNKKKTIGGLIKGLLALAVASSPNLSAQDEGDELYELSPFTVDASSDVGYRATSTLAGTRLNTQLKDVGAAISVMTKELFDDIGATDSTTLLSYGLNTETSGAQGNFVGGNSVVGASTADLADTRVNPQKGQRIRGLAAGDLTRNYFQTDIPFDAYNTERVTISRGPNSLLFGIGSPGGVINNTTMQASTSQDSGEFSIRLGERSSHRETFNYNRALIENRLGIRIAGMYEKNNYQQRPTFDEKNRLYVALNAVLFENDNTDFFDIPSPVTN